MASSTFGRFPVVRVISSNRSSFSVSRLMFTLVIPASFRSSSISGSRSPFVVIEMVSMPGMSWISRMSFTRPRLTVGSPPVRRMCLMPSSANRRMILSSSS